LYNTGIPEIKEVITDLIVILPLKQKFVVNLSKQKPIAEILVNSLKLTDYNLLSFILKKI